MSQDIKERLQELKRLASEATPGPWNSRDSRVYFPLLAGGFDIRGCPKSHENAAYIAAANPATVLDLIAHIEALERQLAELDESNLSLYRQLAAAQLDAQTAWSRYENANSSRITTERQLAELRQAREVTDDEIFDAIREDLPAFRQQDDYLLAHGASLMSEDSHEIIHVDTVSAIARAVRRLLSGSAKTDAEAGR